MKKLFASFAVALALTATAAAQLGVPSQTIPREERKEKTPQARTLTGQVMDKDDAPLFKAIVYLKNTRTLAVKTFITGQDGRFRFPGLQQNVDYEIFAEYEGKKSNTKTLSAFDSREQPTINLHIEVATK